MNARAAMRRHSRVVTTPKNELTDDDLRERAEAAYAYAIAQAVYDRRTALGLTQSELARRTGDGMSQSAIAKIESGVRPPTVPTLLRLARAMESHLRLELADEDTQVAFLPVHAIGSSAGSTEPPASEHRRHRTTKAKRKSSVA